MDEVGDMKISNYENKDHDDTTLRGDQSNTSGMRRAFELSMRHDGFSFRQIVIIIIMLAWRARPVPRKAEIGILVRDCIIRSQ